MPTDQLQLQNILEEDDGGDLDDEFLLASPDVASLTVPPAFALATPARALMPPAR